MKNNRHILKIWFVQNFVLILVCLKSGISIFLNFWMGNFDFDLFQNSIFTHCVGGSGGGEDKTSDHCQIMQDMLRKASKKVKEEAPAFGTKAHVQETMTGFSHHTQSIQTDEGAVRNDFVIQKNADGTRNTIIDTYTCIPNKNKPSAK